MTCSLEALCFDANDPVRLADFWAGVLGWSPSDDPGHDRDDELGDDAGGTMLEPNDDTGFRLRFVPSTAPKVGPNQIHFDLTSQSFEQQQETVARALELGARAIDVGQRPEEQHVVLADLEGNEFCVIEPGNRFLADCGFIGALSCQGSRAVGMFWSAALGWPLVWDHDQETAIRSPHGGPKIAWGGPPDTPKIGRNRLHLDLTTAPDTDLGAEVDRLVAMGARRIDDDPSDVNRVVLADPDGHELCLRASPTQAVQ